MHAFSIFPQKKISRSLLLCIGVVLSLCGCAIRTFEPPCQTYCKTDEWLFSENWYSCYVRGVGCMSGECWEYARDEFMRALEVRSEDTRWAVITYGEHTLPDYFPNRELGIVYYYLHDFENALRYLLISYTHFPSAKTIYYINRIRKEVLISSGEDRESPRLYLTRYVSITNQSTITLNGIALDDTFVAGITLYVNNEEPLSLMGVSMPLFQIFERTIELKPGINNVKIIAYDLLGKQQQKKITIMRDQEGPMIYFSQGLSHVLEAILYDPSDVDYFSLNETQIVLTPVELPQDPSIDAHNKVYYFRYPLSPGELEKITLHYVARDSFNNSTTGTLIMNGEKEETYCPERERIHYAMHPFFVARDIDVEDQIYRENVRITITHCQEETFEKEISPQIRIRADSHIRGVYINDEPVLTFRGVQWESVFSSIIRKYLKGEKKGSIIFPRLIKLTKIGENRITVKVEDEYGRMSEKSIRVMRKERHIDQLNERWRITIPYILQDLQENEEDIEQRHKKLTYKLIKAFQTQKRFNVIEVENLPLIIQEKKLHHYLRHPYLGLPEESNIWIDVILLGTVRTTEDSFHLSTDLVDLETGEILATKDVFEKIDPIDPLYPIWRENKWEHILENAHVLAARFKEHFPLCEGRTITLTEEEIKTSICKNDGLKRGMKLIMYEKFGNNGECTIINEAKVKEVHEQFSRAALAEKLDIINVNEIVMNYAVITR